MNAFGRLISRIHPRLAVVIHDLAMVWLAWYLTNAVRWSMATEPREVALFATELPIVIAAQALVLWWTGLYRGLWRFASLPDLLNIARAAVIGALAISLALFWFNRLEGTPRSVLLLYPLALVLLLGGPRMLYRFWKDSRIGEGPSRGERVLILGAGRAGETLARELKREGRYRPVGFVDDDRNLRGGKLHGIPVLGTVEQLAEIAREVAADALLIAMPSIPNSEMRRVVEACEDTDIPFRTVPRLQDVIDGRFNFNELKEVAIEDLLGREPVTLDWTLIRSAVAGRRVLVTGGGGSIGSELCRQVARLGVETLVVLDLSEFNLYRVEQQLKGEFADLRIEIVLGDCGDDALLDDLLSRHRPEVVFHAAAFKHVPLLESQLREAVRNNVLVTRSLALACERHGCGSFALISTDKAVNPANVMGATKRVAERICETLSRRTRMRIVTVRFGNVLDSAGSVVPLFREQIRRGGPVTVTHPDMTRWFMTIPEACQLILQALAQGRGGEIFALDMGEPVRIAYLAEQMIRLAGKRPGSEVAIVYSGLRPGEKLFEELFHEAESYDRTAHPKIMLAAPRREGSDALDRAVDALTEAVATFDERALRRQLEALVPEYRRQTRGSADVITLEKAS